jgi:hypothetical protein
MVLLIVTWHSTAKAADPACEGDFCVQEYGFFNWWCNRCGGDVCFDDCYMGEDTCWFEGICCGITDPECSGGPPQN